MSTYSWRDAINHTQRLVKGIPLTNLDILTVDQLSSKFWKTYPWGWTRDTLTPFNLVDGQQDYSLDPADQNTLWRLLNARIGWTNVSPTRYRDLRIKRHLEPYAESKISFPNFQTISYEVELDKFRLEANASVPAGTVLQVTGEYQLFPPKVTDLDQTINFPDYHMDVFIDGLLWYLYRLADDKRAGTAVKTPGGVQYTGQMGIFFDDIMRTIETEEHGAGDDIYPGDASIGSSTMFMPGVFGF